MSDLTDAKPNEKTAQPTGIRPFQEKDLKVVRMMIGTSVMEGLARANKQTYFHPLILTLYVLTALILDYSVGWLPKKEIWWSPISMLTGFGAAALPLLGIVEFINRDYFETLLRLRLGSTDLLSIPEYYGPNMSILEYKGEAIGLVGVDYQHPGENLESVISGVRKEDVKGGLNLGWLMGRGKNDEGTSVEDVASSGTSTATDSKSSAKNRKQPSITVASDPSGPVSRKPNHLKGSTAHIRHLYIDALYRGKGLEEELLHHALRQAFESTDHSAIRRVIISTPSYASSALTSLLRSMSFVTVAAGDDAVVPGTPGHEEGQGIMVKDTRRFGVAGWQVVAWSGKWLEITKGQWESWKKQQK